MANVCELCNKVLGTKQSCQAHQRVCKPKQPPPVCTRCNKGFCNQRSLEAHLTRCKKPDEQPKVPPTCQWCDRVFDRQRSLTSHHTRCVFRKIVNNIGNENPEHITTEMILGGWRLINKQITEARKRASKLVTEYERMVRTHPSNKNIIIKNKRSPRCMVYTAKGLVERSLTEVVTESFHRSATVLNQRSAEIGEYNDKVFQSPTNQETFDLLTSTPTRLAVATHRQMIVETCHQPR